MFLVGPFIYGIILSRLEEVRITFVGPDQHDMVPIGLHIRRGHGSDWSFHLRHDSHWPRRKNGMVDIGPDEEDMNPNGH